MHRLLRLALPPHFPQARPGQFVMLRLPDRLDPLLGRPFSVYAMDCSLSAVTLDILYHIAGKGTEAFSRLRAGDALSVLGPLGRGFDLAPSRPAALLIGGGMGVAPLTFLAGALRSRPVSPPTVIAGFLGAKTQTALIGLSRFARACTCLSVSTDDGSRGFHGSVTELFRRADLPFAVEDTALYACGPHGMLCQLARTVGASDRFCEVSVEERMGCGLGACLGCAVPVRDRTGGLQYVRACREGPVFSLNEVIWDRAVITETLQQACRTALTGEDKP
jgi:dihydroorotate dehydrogenase electron transfer subunit